MDSEPLAGVQRYAPNEHRASGMAPDHFGDYVRAADAEGVVLRLQQAIREHRDARGDDRCWLDDELLYRTLPEGYVAPVREVSVELDQCRRFLELRRHPATTYVSPQREIEGLKGLLRALVDQHRCLAEQGVWPAEGAETLAKARQALGA